ncbi:MAG TPA: hypothetical protein VKX39_13865 [Bryobacteraceae bacterium]|jgi:hypothetical protein|nr:hypothetical protein [Bryobacteraceae bacterium]
MIWERIESNYETMCRAAVPGGWLVHLLYRSGATSIAMVFYPDPEHSWDGKSPVLQDMQASQPSPAH